MKKICLTTILLIGFIAAGFSQFALTYQSHGLLADNYNNMKICTYVNPGEGGFNITWDFSELEATKDFEGRVDDIGLSPKINEFPESDVVLKEFSNQFFFSGDASTLKLHGVAINNKTIKKFDNPFVKMRYPFSYGDSFSGDYSGVYVSGNPNGTIDGTYAVTGDGFGTLVLPNGLEVNDVLRVKTIRTYDRTINKNKTNVEIITYRWYAENERFPLLVLIESKANGRVVSNQAAFKENVQTKKSVTSIENNAINSNISVFPNPYAEHVNIEYAVKENSKVKIDVYNSVGNKVSNLVNEFQESGQYKVEFSAKDQGLATGVYYIKLDINNNISVKKVVEIQ